MQQNSNIFSSVAVIKMTLMRNLDFRTTNEWDQKSVSIRYYNKHEVIELESIIPKADTKGKMTIVDREQIGPH